MMARHTNRDTELRGQLMLQIASGRFFQPGAEINEHMHRHTVYSNVFFLDAKPRELPIGVLTGTTEHGAVTSVTVEATDRLEAHRPDGTQDFLIATGGHELIDDIAYVATFTLNRTFHRDHDLVHKLISQAAATGSRRNASDLFPELFEPRQTVQEADWVDLRLFMNDLLNLAHEDFARVMRVIRNCVDATRRAADDPTGAYTDFVATLESLGDDVLTTPTDWERYEGSKRKIIDGAISDEKPETVRRVRNAILEADRVGLKRRFVSSTLTRIAQSYYRGEAVSAVRPPRSADVERMLGLAYDIRSRRSHVLQDLGAEAWILTDGAETVHVPRLRYIYTLAGLWRLVRHIVRQYVVDAPKVSAEPWDYRNALPGVVTMPLAPQYWISQPQTLDATSALQRFEGVVDAFIGQQRGDSSIDFDLRGVVEKIEDLVRDMSDGESKVALVAIYSLWHDWIDPSLHRPHAQEFLIKYAPLLVSPSPTAFTAGLLSSCGLPSWGVDEWANLATARRASRLRGKEQPLPPPIDVLIQIEAADRLEDAGRHEEAAIFASNAAEEAPGSVEILEWERLLRHGPHDPAFDVSKFLFGERPPIDVENKAPEEGSNGPD